MSDLVPVAPKTKRSKLLVASLALNLLVVGLVGGAFAARHRFGPHGDLNVGRILGDPGLRGFVRTLPKERHAILRASGEAARQNVKPLREAALQAKLLATAAMNAEPFDAARVEKAMQNWIEAESQVRRAGIALLVRTVVQMTPEERSQFQVWRKQHEHSPQPAEVRTEQAPQVPR